MKILIVEDDREIANNLKELLKREGYVSTVVESLREAKEEIESLEYDCVILDRGLSDGDGITLVQHMERERITTPVLVLTAKNNPRELVEGLDLGADDYLGKPFRMEELLARVRVLIRRGGVEKTRPILKAADLSINTNNMTINRGNKDIELTPKEYAMLHYLMMNKNKAIDRMTLLTHVWGDEIDLFSNTVDVHIRYLRKKIDEGHKKKLIKTVRGKGYMLCDEN